jgi:DNA-binding NarL/FixJ family response regulator
LADGLSVDEISRKMTVRRDALQVHIRSCAQKLGFRTRSELVDWIVKNRPRTPTRE